MHAAGGQAAAQAGPQQGRVAVAGPTSGFGWGSSDPTPQGVGTPPPHFNSGAVRVTDVWPGTNFRLKKNRSKMPFWALWGGGKKYKGESGG